MDNQVKISTLWFKNIKTQEKQNDFKKLVLACPDVIERLAQILKDKLDSSSTANNIDFESPSWAYKQAFNLGKKAMLEELMVLTEHLNKK